MTVMPKIHQGVSFITNPEALSVFRDPACAATIWSRTPKPGLQQWLDQLGPGVLPKWREILDVEAVREAALDACEEAGTPDCAERTTLLDDMQGLASAFADLMQTSFVQFRLDVIKTNACRRFHLDAVTGRLICTYRGTGTQYGVSLNGEEPSIIETVPNFDPILLRGSLWPTVPDAGVLHRSPPIEGTRETRLVMVLDPVSDDEE